jgi:hypothetical protein
MHVKILAQPNQQVKGSYSVTCAKGYGAGSQSHSFAGRTPLVVSVRHPYALPDNCTIGASAQLQSGGAITLKIYAR